MEETQEDLDSSVAVFAHNLAGQISSCLRSIYTGGLVGSFEIHVLVNGCTDGTAEEVLQFAQDHPQVKLQSIAIGDKANAWNCYVHNFARRARTHFFVDGDVTILPESLRLMASALADQPNANASTAVPVSGRNTGNWVRLITEDQGIAGNLYALRKSFLERLRNSNVRLPIGLIGDDSWVGALVNLNLDVTQGWDKHRTLVCLEARFHYDSLQWYRWRDIRLYWRRRIRYALRSWQNLCMREHVLGGGIFNLPPTVSDLYRLYPRQLKLRWSGVDTLFMWFALRRIRLTLD